MTRQDFQLIADVLKEAAEDWPMSHRNQSEYASLRLKFAERLAATNPRFNADRFLTAAQPDPNAYDERIERMRSGAAAR